MTSRTIRLLVAFAVVVALVGAVGLVSAEMHSDSTDDDSESTHMGEMADHMDENTMEMMQDHMGDHDHEAHHDGADEHC